MSTIRLNKLLATRGVGARRKCDRLIESGLVRVNGEVITAPGARVVEGRDKITVSGKPLPEPSVHRYLMLNKPVGVITTLHDPEGRRNIADLIPREGRLYPVGRLDADTSGLLIVTNDGALAHHLMHPRYGLTKFYRVLLTTEPNEGQLTRLAGGVEFEPGVRSAPARVRRRDPVPRGAVIEIAIHEGRHRQVRRMCEAVGLTVLGLHRWAYGPLKLGELARGVWRDLSEDEVAALRSASARVRPRPEGAGAKDRIRPRAHRESSRTHREPPRTHREPPRARPPASAPARSPRAPSGEFA
ncbi:MAG: pseudouridine synthase, partial [Candidatus Eiseniibacteriota bacterium]